MKAILLYDNQARSGYLEGWGFSCYLPEYKLLFDTGWDYTSLRHNMERAGVEEEKIEKIFISHQHWDHVGGLAPLLRSDLKIYLPASFSEHMKGEIREVCEVIEIGNSRQIAPELWSTGELGNEVKEHSLIVKKDDSSAVITGCAHPGVKNILRAANKIAPVKFLLGGLHGFSQFEELEALSAVVPTHCTQHEEEIAELYPEKYIQGLAGKTIEFEW